MIVYDKYSGAGNLFAIAKMPGLPKEKLSALVRQLCFAAQTDGALFYEADDGTAGRMHYYNADGSRAAFCGNGLRCFARWLADKGRAEGVFSIATDSGVMQAEVTDDEVTVQMGTPHRLSVPEIGLPAGIEKMDFILMNVPHLVLFAGEQPVDNAALRQLYVQHPAFAEGTNVDIVSGEKNALRVYTWERGAGHTLACGTGCCAVAFAAGILRGEKLQVQAEGGTLQIFRDDNDLLWLCGPAVCLESGLLLQEKEQV